MFDSLWRFGCESRWHRGCTGRGAQLPFQLQPATFQKRALAGRQCTGEAAADLICVRKPAVCVTETAQLKQGQTAVQSVFGALARSELGQPVLSVLEYLGCFHIPLLGIQSPASRNRRYASRSEHGGQDGRNDEGGAGRVDACVPRTKQRQAPRACTRWAACDFSKRMQARTRTDHGVSRRMGDLDGAKT